MNNVLTEKGISPAVGVILLIGITAAVATLAGIVLLDVGEGLSQNAQAGVEVNETPDGVQVTWTTDSTAEEIIVQANGQEYRLNSVNDSITLGLNRGSNVSIIGIIDGERSVISETTTESDTGDGTVQNYSPGNTETVSGTVSINSPINGAIVRSVKNNTVINQTTTDSSGSYTIQTPTKSRLEVVVEDFTYESGSKTFYGSTVENLGEDFDSTRNIEFTEPSNTVTVNGESLLIGNNSYNGSKTIGSIEQLQAINDDISSDYILLNDIDADETSEWNNGSGFKPIDNYSGVFDGNNHTISNLSIDRESSNYIGLFGEISENNSTIKNVSLSSASVNGNEFVGGVVGSGDTIQNVNYNGDVSGTYVVGGISGKSTTITDSSADTNITIDTSEQVEYIGGLSGYSREILNSESTGSISIITTSGAKFIGGTVGKIVSPEVGTNGFDVGVYSFSVSDERLAMENITSNSTVTIDADSLINSIGGMTGGAPESKLANINSTSNLTITDATSATRISSVAGIAGTISNSNVNGDITVENQTPIRDAGLLSGSVRYINNSSAEGNITGKISKINNTGLLAGNARARLELDESAISNSNATGTISTDVLQGFSLGIGLLSGKADDEITESYSSGTITIEDNPAYSGLNSVGGLVGQSTTIVKSYSNSDITISNSSGTSFIGGLSGGSVPGSEQTIRNSYSKGTMEINVDSSNLNNNPSGITGSQNEGIIENSYTTIDLDSQYSIINSGSVSASNVYWDTEVTGHSSASKGTGLSTSQMTGTNAESNMTGFDFESVWSTQSDSYPELQD